MSQSDSSSYLGSSRSLSRLRKQSVKAIARALLEVLKVRVISPEELAFIIAELEVISEEGE